MTRFEELEQLAEDCKKKANNTTDKKLKTFYANAAKGFLIKLRKLTIEEACIRG